jgi:hypothetical protein
VGRDFARARLRSVALHDPLRHRIAILVDRQHQEIAGLDPRERRVHRFQLRRMT